MTVWKLKETSSPETIETIVNKIESLPNATIAEMEIKETRTNNSYNCSKFLLIAKCEINAPVKNLETIKQTILKF